LTFLHLILYFNNIDLYKTDIFSCQGKFLIDKKGGTGPAPTNFDIVVE